MKRPPAAGPTSEATDSAIAQVLAAEREARASVERTKLEVQAIAEAARSAARATAERAERRIRCVAAAFERDLNARLAEIEAEAAQLESLPPPGEAEQLALQREVAAIAHQLIGAPP